ncbi:DUF819 family protein, partial [Fulvivirga sp. RKSG066]|uniref:DUF819 family protein n=1 Tax=Fulvivirga aurantia TaxID=2529383 RepID=UPI0012BD824C
MVMLAVVFKTATLKAPFWQKFYKIIPTILLCYFLPSLLNTFGIVDAEESQVYFVASRYLLPACLVLLTISVDLKEILKLGPKALVMFFTATVGVVIGGPLAILITSLINPDLVGGAGADELWRGMSTIAGSWIGGGANQAAMYELFEPSDALFSTSITVDVIVAEIWMAALLLGIGKNNSINDFFKADNTGVETLRNKMEAYSASIAKIPTVVDLMMMLGIGFGITGFAHLMADGITPMIVEYAPELKKFSLDSNFFWIIVIATTLGIILSFTKLRELEGAGASKIGTVFIFILVASIGMKMDVTAIFENPGFFLVGIIWMAIHVTLLVIMAKLIKAPYFFLAVGSKANIGGAASAPVLAAAFHPSLAPVGVLLAVLGYALGTYGAYLCGILMQLASQ